jgi:oxygen-independent coproporphyrinogen-3 oxidase
MYEVTQSITTDAGYRTYEISNHAKPDQESRHNLLYWHYGDYVGIGPGAHGRVTIDGQRYATEAPLGPFDWLKAVRVGGSGESERSLLSLADQTSEFLLMGLRVTEGVALSRFDNLSNGIYDNNIKYLSDMGMVIVADEHLRVTQKGRPLLNAVLNALLSD